MRWLIALVAILALAVPGTAAGVWAGGAVAVRVSREEL